MKILLASTPVINHQTEYNLQTMLRYINESKGAADLILFGESALQGFDSLCWDHKKDIRTAVTLQDSPIRTIRTAAAVNGIAVSFGFIERCHDDLYSSQIFIGASGEIRNVFHRVSIGWKEYTRTDAHYREGMHFEKFLYQGKSFATGLCGDLWNTERPEEINTLHADIVLWPVWCDYPAHEWNGTIKQEYAEQAALCGKNVLLVNPFCADPEKKDKAAGGCIHFQNGEIHRECPAGSPGILLTTVE